VNYVIPKRGNKSFTCPYCDTVAEQKWNNVSLQTYGHAFHTFSTGHVEKPQLNIYASTCQSCEKYHIWIGNKMIIPDSLNIPIPNADMPDEIKKLYLEARSITDKSPKAAAALLRLALQHLCIHLGGKGKNINADIADFVKSGLDPRVQKSLDIVRIAGNNAVHPGQLDIDDNPDISYRLFSLMNFVVSSMITQPKLVDTFFDEMPEDARTAIEKRDAVI
jgi:hypothetical protein